MSDSKVCSVYFNFNLDASSQMALDHALFEDLQKKNKDAFLRFYTIFPRAFTLGYFIKDIPQGFDEEVPIVKRLTGGGIVNHDQDLVFSLGAKRDALPFFRSTSESYVAIHSVIQQAFLKESIPAELVSCKVVKVPGTRGTGTSTCPPGTRYHSENVCFQNPVAGDVMVRGQKIAGGAQKREKGYFLHQGSIQRMQLEAKELSEVLLDAFDDEWDFDFKIEELSPEILTRAKELSEGIYEQQKKS